jgi:hypothetical protein
MQYYGLVARTEKFLGKKLIAVYKCTPKGFDFGRNILEPYESIFPG